MGRGKRRGSSFAPPWPIVEGLPAAVAAGGHFCSLAVFPAPDTEHSQELRATRGDTRCRCRLSGCKGGATRAGGVGGLIIRAGRPSEGTGSRLGSWRKVVSHGSWPAGARSCVALRTTDRGLRVLGCGGTHAISRDPPPCLWRAEPGRASHGHLICPAPQCREARAPREPGALAGGCSEGSQQRGRGPGSCPVGDGVKQGAATAEPQRKVGSGTAMCVWG